MPIVAKPSVALITCQQLPEPDHDQQLLLDALAGAGLSVQMLAWDDPAGDPAAFDLCVLRSCWNYFDHEEAFLSWIDRTATQTRLANPAPIVRWNFHKQYLQELEAQGLPVVPTVWCPAGQPAQLAQTMESKGWDDVVVKPSVSGGSYKTRRFTQGQLEEGQVFLDELLAERDGMIQRTIAPAAGIQESALVWIDGELTHAVTKQPRFSGGDESVSAAQPINPAQTDLARRVLAAIEGDLLYGRVDVMTDSDGQLLLSELELLEPSLFLAQHPPALERLVSAIERSAAEAQSLKV